MDGFPQSSRQPHAEGVRTEEIKSHGSGKSHCYHSDFIPQSGKSCTKASQTTWPLNDGKSGSGSSGQHNNSPPALKSSGTGGRLRLHKQISFTALSACTPKPGVPPAKPGSSSLLSHCHLEVLSQLFCLLVHTTMRAAFMQGLRSGCFTMEMT
jgi:hypothetical protein